MSDKMVLCRIKKIDFQHLRNLMVRNRIYVGFEFGGERMLQRYSYVTAVNLHKVLNSSIISVYIRTDGIY